MIEYETRLSFIDNVRRDFVVYVGRRFLGFVGQDRRRSPDDWQAYHVRTKRWAYTLPDQDAAVSWLIDEENKA